MNMVRLEDYGLDSTKLIAGVFGGATHIFLDKWSGWFKAMGSLFIGIAAANYIGDLPFNYGVTVFGKNGSVYVVATFASIILRIIGTYVASWTFKNGNGAGGGATMEKPE